MWPDYPHIYVNESLDWDTQVEVWSPPAGRVQETGEANSVTCLPQLYRSYAAFPDFLRTSTANWWHREIKEFYENTMKFDGLWIVSEQVGGVGVGGAQPG